MVLHTPVGCAGIAMLYSVYMNEQLGRIFSFLPFLFCAVVTVGVAVFIFVGVVIRPTLAFAACPSGTYINDETDPSPPPLPPSTTRSINPDTQALSKQCEKGKQYKIRILTSEEISKQPKYRCIGPINELGSKQPVAIDVTWQNGIEPGQPADTLPEAIVSFQTDLDGKKFISIYCREGSDLKKEFEKNPFTNGFAREARDRGLDEEVDALARAYENKEPLEIKQAASKLVSKGLDGIYDGFKNNPDPARSDLLKDQVFVDHLDRIAKEHDVTASTISGSVYGTDHAVENARKIIAADLKKFAAPDAVKRLEPGRSTGRSDWGVGLKRADEEPPAETKSGESTFQKTPTRAPETLNEAAHRVEMAHKAYEDSCWFDRAWCSSQKEAELIAAQKAYKEMYERENLPPGETADKKISRISQSPREEGYKPDPAFENDENDKKTQRTQPPDDSRRADPDGPAKKLRADLERLRRENEALRRRGGGRTTSPSGDEGWWRLLGGGTTQNNACTETAYRLCVTPPHNYQACMACQQGGPQGGLGGQNQNPLIDLLKKLFGIKDQTDPAISQAMCGQYPGTQFINGRCQCPLNTQWMANTQNPYGATPFGVGTVPTQPNPNPYAYPYSIQPSPYGGAFLPYGYGYPPPTGSCQPINVCAQYPGTHLSVGPNRCECSEGQQWTGTKCETPAPTPEAQIRAELSCSSRVVDVGTPLSISWSCVGATTARGSGFDTKGQTRGSSELTLEGVDSNGNPVPPFNLTLTCVKEARTATAQCPIEINRPFIITAAVPTIVARGEKATIGWIVKGMKEGDDICRITSDKHSGFSETGRNKIIETPPITELTKFTIHCTTRGGNTKKAEVVIAVK